MLLMLSCITQLPYSRQLRSWWCWRLILMSTFLVNCYPRIRCWSNFDPFRKQSWVMYIRRYEISKWCSSESFWSLKYLPVSTTFKKQRTDWMITSSHSKNRGRSVLPAPANPEGSIPPFSFRSHSGGVHACYQLASSLNCRCSSSPT